MDHIDYQKMVVSNFQIIHYLKNLDFKGILVHLFRHFLVDEKKRVDSNISNAGNIVKIVRIRNLKIDNKDGVDKIDMEMTTNFKIKDIENVRVGVLDI